MHIHACEWVCRGSAGCPPPTRLIPPNPLLVQEVQVQCYCMAVGPLNASSLSSVTGACKAAQWFYFCRSASWPPWVWLKPVRYQVPEQVPLRDGGSATPPPCTKHLPRCPCSVSSLHLARQAVSLTASWSHVRNASSQRPGRLTERRNEAPSGVSEGRPSTPEISVWGNPSRVCVFPSDARDDCVSHAGHAAQLCRFPASQ